MRHPIAAVGVGLVLAAATVGLFMTGRHRIPAAGRRGRVRHRLPDAGRLRARGDRPPGARDREDSAGDAGSGVVFPADRVRARPVCDGAEHRRHPGPAEAAQRSASRIGEEIISDLRPKLHEAAPLAEIEFVQLLQDMLGDLEGSPTPIEVKIFGDDPEVLEQTGRAGRGHARQDRRRRRRRRHAARQSRKSRGPSMPRPRAALGLTVEQVAQQLVGGVARRRRAPTCGCSIDACRSACGCRTRSGSIRRKLRADAAAHERRESSCRSRAVAHDDPFQRAVGAAAREPAQHGARHRAVSRAAIWAARSPRSNRGCRN